MCGRRLQQVELALGGLHLGQVDVEEADRLGIKLLPARLIPLDLGRRLMPRRSKHE
jgi:hypothetical protein